MSAPKGSDEFAAAKRQESVTIYGGFGEGDVTVTADPGELWERYGTELREDGMEGKTGAEVIEHVYGQNPDAPELEVEDAYA